MAKTPERAVKDRIKAFLDGLGPTAYYCMPIGTGYGNSGVPDFIVNYLGYFIAIEAKAKGGQPTALQQKHMDCIYTSKGLAIVVDENNFNDLPNIFAWWASEKEAGHAR
jgi:hypothetical protein